MPMYSFDRVGNLRKCWADFVASRENLHLD
jgi:hypothetical protein